MPKLPSRVSLWHIKHLTMSCMRQAHDGGRYAEQGMNHIILTLLIAVMLSGCVNLSKRNYMMVSDGGTDYFDSSSVMMPLLNGLGLVTRTKLHLKMKEFMSLFAQNHFIRRVLLSVLLFLYFLLLVVKVMLVLRVM